MIGKISFTEEALLRIVFIHS